MKRLSACLFVVLAVGCGGERIQAPPRARLMVSLDPGVRASEFNARSFSSDPETRIIPSPELAKIGVVLVDVPLDVAEVTALDAEGMDGVSSVEADGVVHLIDPVTVTLPIQINDLRADALALDPLVPNQYQSAITKAADAWNLGIRGQGVTIAVIDTGIDCGHPDLACVQGKDFTGSGSTDDGHGHGTHVAGIAAAIGGNGRGGSGIAPAAKVQPVRVLGSNGEGSFSGVAAGIVWAADNGAAVLNMSLGGPVGWEPLARAIDYARAKGKVVVCAAGNESTSNPTYPASYPGCTGVGATDREDRTAGFSNFGVNAKAAFPGVSILSTCRGNAYCSMSGTSMASPGYAGAVALAIGAGLSGAAAEVDLKAFGDAVSGRLAGMMRANLGRAAPVWRSAPIPTAADPTPTIRPTEVRPTITPFPRGTNTAVPTLDPASPAPPITSCRVVAVEDAEIVVRCRRP